MFPSYVVLLWQFFFGISIVAVSIPLVLGKVKRNHMYGVRMAKALESDANWLKINTFGGKLLLVSGACMSFSGITAFFITDVNLLLLLLVFIDLCCVLCPLPFIVRYAKKL